MSYVLDSSVILAKFFEEPGAGSIDDQIIAEGRISTVNLSEVIAKLAEQSVAQDQIDYIREQFAPRTHDFDAEQARTAGLLRPATRAAGLSLGDRACLALALSLDTPVLTADRAWAGLDLGARIEVVR